MRKLQAQDIFTFSKLLKKMNVKNEVKAFFDGLQSPDTNNGEKKSVGVGLDIIFLLFENISNAEQEFYDFIGPISEKPIEELKALPLDELMEICRSIYADTNFASFFKFAAQ